VLGDFDDLAFYDGTGLFQHLTGPFMKDPGAGFLQDVEGSAFDFPDLIIAEDPKEYRPVFAKGRLDHITSLGFALLLCKHGSVDKSAENA
jgi:hypothetical protein